MAIVLLPQCMATSNTTAAVDISDTITSLAATAYSNYIATESTEPDFRSTIQQITAGNKPAKKEIMLHGWVQNMRGSVNNTFKWCGLLDSLSEEEPDYAVISETTKDNDPTQLLFLHMYQRIDRGRGLDKVL